MAFYGSDRAREPGQRKDTLLAKSTKSKGRRRGRRRWVVYGLLLLVLLVVLALYETQQELRRAQGPSADQTLGPAEQAERGRSALTRYYRSHDLPSGWETGEITASAEDGMAVVTVPLHFAPGIRSERHGKAARPNEMTPAIGCPTPRGPWAHLGSIRLDVEVHDKTGLINTFRCGPPPAEDASG